MRQPGGGCVSRLCYERRLKVTISIPSPPRRFLHDLTFSGLESEIVNAGLSRVHARTLWRALHRDAETNLSGRADFPPPLRRWVDARIAESGPFFLDAPEVAADVASSDGCTRKFLLKLADGQSIETVIMGYPGRFTACVSTQAGCAMGCVFCATGQMGFARHLRPGEIVAQILHCQRILRRENNAGLRNVVLMGMGEPLHNYDAVMTGLEIVSDTRGLNIGPARITISTVGVVPGILRLAEENRPYNLAVSLHGATDAARSALVPAGRRWPLAELMDACRVYASRTGRRVFFEWTLIAGTNDSPAHAGELVRLLEGIESHVNLIPLNPTDGFGGLPGASRAALEFQRVLKSAGIPGTVRQRRGIDVAAGCGQLRTMHGGTAPQI